jgi:hypothetical protein
MIELHMPEYVDEDDDIYDDYECKYKLSLKIVGEGAQAQIFKTKKNFGS